MKRDFFIWNKLDKIFINANNELYSILNEIKKTDNNIILKSLFTYGVSTFENVLTDTLRYFIVAFPTKLPEKKLEVTKNELIKEIDFLIEKTIDKTVNSLSYGTLDKFLETFIKILEINKIDENRINQLIEIKETRNLIIHNNLKINTVYLSKCKPECVRANVEQLNQNLPFNKQYAYESIEFCQKVLFDNIYNPVKSKYSALTKIQAMKEIWNELFNSPILKFDDYWEYDGQGNLLYFILDRETLESHICIGYSSTEKILALYIFMHYWGSLPSLDGIDINLFNPMQLYGDRKKKFLYLQDILFRYPELFTQDL